MTSSRPIRRSIVPFLPRGVTVKEAREAIASRVSPLRARVCRDAVTTLAEIAVARRRELSPSELLWTAELALREYVPKLREVQDRERRFTEQFFGAETEDERKQFLASHILETVEAPAARRRDLKALDLWLDPEALLDREAHRLTVFSQCVTVAAELVAGVAAEAGDAERAVFEQGVARRRLFDAALYDGPSTMRAACLAALTVWFEGDAIGAELRAREGQRIARHVFRRDLPRWVEIRALELLFVTAPEDATAMAWAWLRDRHQRADDFIQRRNALRLLGLHGAVEDPDTYRSVFNDPSEHVRQELCRVLRAMDHPAAIDLLLTLMEGDSSPRVRAVAFLELAERAQDDALAQPALALAVPEMLRREAAPLLLRVVLDALPDLAFGPQAILDPSSLVSGVEDVCIRAEDAFVGELAASILRDLEVRAQPSWVTLAERIRAALPHVREGKRYFLAIDDMPVMTEEVVARILRFAGRGDLGVSLRKVRGGYWLTRGEPRGRRLWRIYHELTHPMPDKRQGYVHTRARVLRDTWRIPPVGMSEVTRTNVPGERRFVPSAAGWAPFLPRVDDLLDACVRGPVRLVTSAGLVLITPPKSLRQRARTFARLTFRYANFADLRESSLDATEPSDRRGYVDALRALGFDVTLDAQPGVVGAARFQVELPWVRSLLATQGAVLPPVVDEAARYLSSPSGNSPAHLASVAFALFLALLVRALVQRFTIERAINAVPLTIGGWGTRGKSGTERLKAGLFHALGFDVVVKTTGCEAMFIHGVPGRQANEVFLFRPYDKATIWEQNDVVNMAAGLGAQVFLWECMALRPAFVEVLAHQWMRGDMATLTNAYPDHEDIQGPSGEDVARVIARFMPKSGGLCITTEEQMLPLLREQAAQWKTNFVAVPPVEADLLPHDLVDRFPYQEHPRNIALVATMAESLGIDREQAIVDMSDFVVPDLGVLKTYPAVEYRAREVFFSNGMSANERAGCLGNWTRLGLSDHQVTVSPELSVATVVNNRADRVPRSRVFARIMVQDVSVHAHVLIGTNLAGLRGFVAEELDAWLARTRIADAADNLASDGGARTRVIGRFDEYLARLKLPPPTQEALLSDLRRLLATLEMPHEQLDACLAQLQLKEEGVDARAFLERLKSVEAPDRKDGAAVKGDVLLWAKRLVDRFVRVVEARGKVARAKTPEEANGAFRAFYKVAFMENVVIVPSAFATGDQVIHAVTTSVPPGQRIHLVGLQNIKGTGLGFVYRWLSVDRVRQSLDRFGEEPSAREEVLNWLLTYPDYTLIDAQMVRKELEPYLGRDDLADVETLLKKTFEHVQRIEDAGLQKVERVEAPSVIDRVLLLVERWLDPFDAILRRRRAQRVGLALRRAQVGHNRAAALMREITSRDKGGWLVKWWKKRAAKQ